MRKIFNKFFKKFFRVRGRKKRNADKDNLDGPDNGFQINQNWN